MSSYGLKLWNAAGKTSLDVTDRITRIIWQGEIPFPFTAPTSQNGYLTNAYAYVYVDSQAFLEGEPFILHCDHNIRYGTDSNYPIQAICTNLSWIMETPTRMKITYSVFAPGWTEANLREYYSGIPVPVSIGLY